MIRLSLKYDAYYDAKTLEWLEPKCGDEYCPYCKDRPDKAPNDEIDPAYLGSEYE